MKRILLCATCLTASYMSAYAMETNTSGVEGPKAVVSVLEIKIDQMTAALNASIQAVNVKVTNLQKQVAQMQGQLNSVITCGAQTAVFDGSKCVPVSSSTTGGSSTGTSTSGSGSGSYIWQTAWGGCSAPSGGGTQSLKATCYSSATGAAVASSYCTTTPPTGTQKCNMVTMSPLDCASSSWAAVNLYKGMAGRCADSGGMIYWDGEHDRGTPAAQVMSEFSGAYTNNCAAYGTTSWSACNSKWLCNPGFSYVANSTQCQ